MIEYLSKAKSDDDIFDLYESIGWNQYLHLTKEQLLFAMNGSWYVVYVYMNKQLIGTGRVVSDGVINGYICGIGVDLRYRNQGIGARILNMLVEMCQEKQLHIQLLCEENLKSYYEQKAFKKFAIGMKYMK